MLLAHDVGSMDDLLVARSGYDAAHRCGFIAAESATSAEWHKGVILGYGGGVKKFRAWARGEHPTLFQLRVFLPPRYNIIPSTDSVKILCTYNPFLKDGTFELQREENIGDGRALFFNISRDAFLIVRNNYKLNFPLGKVDCNNATPKPSSSTITRPANPKPSSTKTTTPPLLLILNPRPPLSPPPHNYPNPGRPSNLSIKHIKPLYPLHP
jgi:hypothetical protein